LTWGKKGTWKNGGMWRLKGRKKFSASRVPKGVKPYLNAEKILARISWERGMWGVRRKRGDTWSYWKKKGLVIVRVASKWGKKEKDANFLAKNSP